MRLRIIWELQIDDEPAWRDSVTVTNLSEPIGGAFSAQPLITTALKLVAKNLIPELLDQRVVPAHHRLQGGK